MTGTIVQPARIAGAGPQPLPGGSGLRPGRIALSGSVHCDALGNPWTHRGDELAAKLHALVARVLERGRTQAWPAEDVVGSVQRIIAGELDPRRPSL